MEDKWHHWSILFQKKTRINNIFWFIHRTNRFFSQYHLSPISKLVKKTGTKRRKEDYYSILLFKSFLNRIEIYRSLGSSKLPGGTAVLYFIIFYKGKILKHSLLLTVFPRNLLDPNCLMFMLYEVLNIEGPDLCVLDREYI